MFISFFTLKLERRVIGWGVKARRRLADARVAGETTDQWGCGTRRALSSEGYLGICLRCVLAVCQFN
ncbi:unnamed protein product [Leptosia nina]|uniref:Uncharacterized protein n=1 Tax=Leptosia nina TaxID=320188 RepID=A0AAV1JZU6_9NEOP